MKKILTTIALLSTACQGFIEDNSNIDYCKLTSVNDVVIYDSQLGSTIYDFGNLKTEIKNAKIEYGQVSITDPAILILKDQHNECESIDVSDYHSLLIAGIFKYNFFVKMNEIEQEITTENIAIYKEYEIPVDTNNINTIEIRKDTEAYVSIDYIVLQKKKI